MDTAKDVDEAVRYLRTACRRVRNENVTAVTEKNNINTKLSCHK
jgi:hypothetical protein